jgi:hypothetical protein
MRRKVRQKQECREWIPLSRTCPKCIKDSIPVLENPAQRTPARPEFDVNSKLQPPVSRESLFKGFPASGTFIGVFGVHNIKIGIRNAVIGVQNPGIGVRNAVIGVRNMNIGARSAEIGVRSHEIGVKNAGIGVRNTPYWRQKPQKLGSGIPASGFGRKNRCSERRNRCSKHRNKGFWHRHRSSEHRNRSSEHRFWHLNCYIICPKDASSFWGFFSFC